MSDDGLTTLEASRLRTSERCCELFIARGTTDIPVAEIALAAEISQRSFHRYFRSKAESIGPLLDATIRSSNAVIVGSGPDLPLPEVLRLAFRGSLLNRSATRTEKLFPLVFRDPEMWAVFIRKLHDGERLVAPILALRVGLAPESIAARAAAAAVASSIRVALEVMVTTGADPEAIYVQALDEFAATLRRR